MTAHKRMTVVVSLMMMMMTTTTAAAMMMGMTTAISSPDASVSSAADTTTTTTTPGETGTTRRSSRTADKKPKETSGTSKRRLGGSSGNSATASRNANENGDSHCRDLLTIADHKEFTKYRRNRHVGASSGTGTGTGGSTKKDEVRFVIAHRGASFQLPEHTLEAYRAALEMGADYVEPDVVASSDGVLHAIHTADLNKTTDVHEVFGEDRSWLSPTEGRVGYWSYNFSAEEISQLRVVQRLPDHRSRRYDGMFAVPTLTDIVRLVHEWNRRILPSLMFDADVSDQEDALDSDDLSDDQKRLLVLAQSGLYVELKDAAWIMQDTGMDLVEMLFLHFRDQAPHWEHLLRPGTCDQNGNEIVDAGNGRHPTLAYDQYLLPGLIVQSFDHLALQRFHDRWTYFQQYSPDADNGGGGDTPAPTPPSTGSPTRTQSPTQPTNQTQTSPSPTTTAVPTRSSAPSSPSANATTPAPSQTASPTATAVPTKSPAPSSPFANATSPAPSPAGTTNSTDDNNSTNTTDTESPTQSPTIAGTPESTPESTAESTPESTAESTPEATAASLRKLSDADGDAGGYDASVSDAVRGSPKPPLILLVNGKDCQEEIDGFWFHVGETYRDYVDGIGCDKSCLIPPNAGGGGPYEPTYAAAQALELNMVLHPWTERPEQEYLQRTSSTSTSSPVFSNSVEETRYLFCEVGVQALFTEDVTGTIVAANMGCGPGEQQDGGGGGGGGGGGVDTGSESESDSESGDGNGGGDANALGNTNDEDDDNDARNFFLTALFSFILGGIFAVAARWYYYNRYRQDGIDRNVGEIEMNSMDADGDVGVGGGGGGAGTGAGTGSGTAAGGGVVVSRVGKRRGYRTAGRNEYGIGGVVPNQNEFEFS